MRVLIILLGFVASVAVGYPHTNEVIDKVLFQPNDKNLVEKAAELGLTTLLELATTAGLADTLATGGPFTIFAPTNEAFDNLDKWTKAILARNVTALTEVLLFHLYDGYFKADAITNELKVPSKVKGLNIRLNTYGSGVTATGSPVIKVDQVATNGIIHVIDKVMYPLPKYDIVDFVSVCPFYSTLLAAVQAADLVDALRGDPLTLFAPSNDAFAKIPADQLADLLANKTRLTKVLTYHVASGTTYSAGLSNNDEVPTLEGNNVNVTITDAGDVMIDDSKVTYVDLAVSNGAVHSIDTVLMPPDL